MSFPNPTLPKIVEIEIEAFFVVEGLHHFFDEEGILQDLVWSIQRVARKL